MVTCFAFFSLASYLLRAGHGPVRSLCCGCQQVCAWFGVLLKRYQGLSWNITPPSMPRGWAKPHCSVCCWASLRAAAIFSAREAVTGIFQVCAFATLPARERLLQLGFTQKRGGLCTPTISKRPVICAPRSTHRKPHAKTQKVLRWIMLLKAFFFTPVFTVICSHKTYCGRCLHSKNLPHGYIRKHDQGCKQIYLNSDKLLKCDKANIQSHI